MHALLVIFFRWLHVASATIAIGGVFFMRILVPIGLVQLEPNQREAVFLKLRRVFKMAIHSCILFLLISGIYNSMGNWAAYQQVPAASQPLWGTHVLLAAIIFAIALYVTAGAKPPKIHAKLMIVNLILMAITLAVAAGLKYVRDNRATFIASGTITQLLP
jgi:uncharacterized membrane protein